ncbi:serine protease 53-like [Toxorhynchites rutilus septentrionalis]|uniref:serine protease 53-like n=1 Tax=Toxorhynchites rutilus septentrionalis TaxID=329112 RepID=UPI00247B246E|nr:serine protease 53-like [Toxorhynchites rutilus septentrionalis]
MDFQLLVYLVVVGSVCDSCVRFATAEFFTDQPPDDYFQRKTMTDCPDRFYSDRQRYDEESAYGGERAKIGEFQHMAAIGWTKDDEIKYKCGGTLIGPTFILTAAHCAYDENNNAPDTVRLGDTNLGSPEDDQYAQQIKIKSLKRHPEYRFTRKYYDIALIELESEAKFNDGICPACLWLESDVPRQELTAIGFGVTGFAESPSPTLQKVRLNETDTIECSIQLPISNRTLPYGLVKEQFCANSATMDTCEGDSGGPIQVDRIDVNKALVPLVVGIVSFGTPCVEGSTGVYTRVSSYKEWIEQEIQRPIDYMTCARTSNCYFRRKQQIGITYPLDPPQHRVGLLWDIEDRNKFRCGATLIDYRFVLTSAFCARTKQGSPLYIIVQGTDEIVLVESVYVHPRYDPEDSENDIALLKLTKYLEPSSGALLPVCLWREQEVRDQFGMMHFSAYSNAFSDLSSYTKNNHQRYVIESSIIENGKCANPEHNENNLLCGHNQINLIPNICEMDYGGPVMNLSYHDYLPYLYGVVSTLSSGCGEDLVGTRVYPYLEWIESIVLDHENERFYFTS